jgi:RimJ/RimL family protein N-acetyltransferase
MRSGRRGKAHVSGFFVQKGERLCGGVGLAAHLEHNRADLGYWIGVPFWGNGYCTEAAHEVLRFGFENLRLHRIDGAFRK